MFTPLSAALRLAIPADAERLAHMHRQAWRETYTGLLPQHLIEARTLDERTLRWERMLRSRAIPGAETVFLFEQAGEVLGFAGCGRQSANSLLVRGYDGELGSLYVLAKAQRQGVGAALWVAANQSLADHGFKAASLWVLRANHKARAFYEQRGGHLIAEQQEERLGTTLEDVGYGWTLEPYRAPTYAIDALPQL